MARDNVAGDAAWEMLAGAEVVLDGVLGTGLKGAPRARQARAIQAVNAAAAMVVALGRSLGR